MIKIEKMSDNCIAVINGSQNIFEGQLLTHAEIGTLVVESGIVQYSIDEKEIVTVASANSTNLNDSANSTNLNDRANSTNLNDSANSTNLNDSANSIKPLDTEPKTAQVLSNFTSITSTSITSANSTNLNDSANSTNLNDSANSIKPKQSHVSPKPVPTPKPLK